MPVNPKYAHLYKTAEWERIRAEVKREAGWKCKECGVKNGTLRKRKTPGLPVKLGGHVWINNELHYYVVITVAHLDWNPENMEKDNLRAMCQECHLAYDRPEHLRLSAETRARNEAHAHQRAGQLVLL